jgi:ubiquinone biosynthesis UbiH/UbiF/VisC/COQ6 family hydroxylase
MNQFDIAVVGAGPAGLAFALAAAPLGLRVALFDQQPEAQLADPAPDGREIALTHASRATLERLGVWSRIPEAEVSPLKDAQVFDGPSLLALRFRAADAGTDAIGLLVPNHWIRRALYETVTERGAATLITGARVASVVRGDREVSLTLEDGRTFRASLLVAADTRFSRVRAQVGIGASRLDFQRTMMLVRMTHDAPHGHVAWEWFGYGGQTLALLPLNHNVSGIVVTMAHAEIARLMALSDAALAEELTRRFDGRLGRMTVVSERFAYPLVAVYAHDFVARRVALIGDAAVGMHPVTAHGFNFGLASAVRLTEALTSALAAGAPLHAQRHLLTYERTHRRATWPLYQATNLVATLYTRDAFPARVARRAALTAAAWFRPFQQAVLKQVVAQ